MANPFSRQGRGTLIAPTRSTGQAALPTIEPVPSDQPSSPDVITPMAEALVAPEAWAEAGLTPAGDAPLTEAARASLRHQVLALSWPVIIENLLQSLIGFVDTALVGHLGTDALAGVGGAQQIVWLVSTLLAGVTMGATVLVARAIGGQQPAEARRVFKQSLLLAAGVAAILTVLLTVLALPAMAALGLDGQSSADGVLYLQISGLVTPVMVAMFAGSAVLRGAGDTRTPMYITGFINVINAGAAYALIYGFGPIPALGVAGSAWAAGLSRLIGCLLLAWVFFRPRQVLSLRERTGWRLDMGLVRRMLNIGLPTAGEQFMLSLGLTLYGLVVISLGTTIYATQRASMMIVLLAFLPGLGFAMAATTLVGQSLGAGKVRQAEEGTWIAARYCMVLMGLIGLGFALFGEPLMHVFSDDPLVTRLGGEVLIIACLSQPFMALGQVMAGGLRGAGDTRYPLLVTMAAVWGIRLPLGWTLAVLLGFGLPGAYVAYVLDTLARAFFMWWRWHKARWKTIKI